MIETSTILPVFDVQAIRKEFPILKREVKGKPLVYFDNAATSQKPQVVIDTISNYYSFYNANIHRGIHSLAEEATAAFENTRLTVQEFLGASSTEEIIFTRGTTESINLVAQTWGRQNVRKGDEILISAMEHHSNRKKKQCSKLSRLKTMANSTLMPSKIFFLIRQNWLPLPMDPMLWVPSTRLRLL